MGQFESPTNRFFPDWWEKESGIERQYIGRQTPGQKSIVGWMRLRKQCVLTRSVGRGLKPQDVHSHHPEAASNLQAYIVTIQKCKQIHPICSSYILRHNIQRCYRQIHCCDLLCGRQYFKFASGTKHTLYRSNSLLQHSPSCRPVFVMTDRSDRNDVRMILPNYTCH